MKKIYFSRKLKEFKTLSRRVRYLLKRDDIEAVNQLCRLRDKLNDLLQELKFAYSRIELKRILGTALLVFGLLFINDAKAQWFEEPVENPFGLSSTYYHSFPAAADLDNDGDLDLLVGEYFGDMQYFENTGTASEPAFAAPSENPFGLSSTYYNALPTFADLDNDGDIDLLVGEYYGVFQYFENTGTATAPAFANPVANPFGLDSAYTAAPTFVDIDDDGDYDLIVGTLNLEINGYYYNIEGGFKYFENTGTASAPAFADPVDAPFGLPTTGYQIPFPSFGDLDDDGDLDLLTGSYDGLTYYENIGTSLVADFDTGQLDPFGIDSSAYNFTSLLIDLDDDGDLDILSGTYGFNYYTYGAPMNYYENIGTEPVGINEAKEISEVSLYPNPVRDLLIIGTEKEIDRIEIIDVIGKTSQRSLRPSNQLYVGDLSPGLYSIKIIFDDDSYSVKKILKE